MKLTDRRVGRFQISLEVIESDPAVVRAVMGRCIIMRAEAYAAEQLVEYQAISPDFDEVKAGEVIPAYNVVVRDAGADICFERARIPQAEVQH